MYVNMMILFKLINMIKKFCCSIKIESINDDVKLYKKWKFSADEAVFSPFKDPT